MNLRAPDEGLLTSPRDLIDMLRGYYDALKFLLTPANEVTMTVVLAAGDNFIFHTLGHAVVEWQIFDKDATADVWRSATANATPNHLLILQSSAVATVKLRLT